MNVPPRVLALGIVGIFLALGAVAMEVGGRVRTDNRPSSWGAGSGEAAGFARLRERFGGDESVLVRIEGLETPSQLAFARRLEKRLVPLPGVARVVGPFGVRLFPGRSEIADLNALDDRPLTRSLGLVDAAEGRLDWVLLMQPSYGARTLADLDEGLARLRSEAQEIGLRMRAAGHPLLAHALDEESRRVQRVFAPLLAGVTFLALALVLRSLARAVLIVLVSGVGALVPRSLQVLFDWPIDLVTVAAGPLTFVILVAASLHLTAAWRRGRTAGRSPTEAARHAVREKRVAAALSALTTAAGFGVFAVSEVEAVRRLGFLMAMTVPLTVGLVFLGLPRLLAGLGGRVPRRRKRGTRPWRRTARWAVRHRGPVIVGGVLVFLGGAACPAFLDRNTSALDFFPRGHAVREEFVSLEEDGAALSTIELMAHAKAGERVPLGQIRGDLAARLAAIDGVRGVIGPETIAQEALHVAGPAGLAVLPVLLERSGRIDPSGRSVRWTLRVPTRDAAHLGRLADEVRELADSARELEGLEVDVTGTMVRVFALQEALLDTLTASLGLALLAVALVFLALTRSVVETLIALLVNLVPVGGALLVAGAVGLGLDAATVMVAAVVLGVSVDNTVHDFGAAGADAGRRRPGRRLRALARVGAPATVSGLALTGGFLALVASGFRPTSAFGFLTAVGVATSILANLLLLPALWIRPLRT